MSLEAVVWVKNLEYDSMPYGEFRILLILAEHANGEGERAFRSAKKLADTLGVTPRTIRRWIASLVDLGYIVEGNQAYVSHIPQHVRPKVYNLRMVQTYRGTALQLPETEAELDEDSIPETPVIHRGTQLLTPVTTADRIENQKHIQTLKSFIANHVGNPSSERCPNSTSGHSFIDRICGRCGMHEGQIYNPVSGDITWPVDIELEQS
jgi:DNA-binding Lrp family transcriptional regulator